MLTIKEKIQQTGLKATPQRIAVYKEMQNLGHACADMVAENLKESFPSLTVATIYNVLDSFVEVGLLVKRFSSNNKMYFDVNTYDHVHIYDEQLNAYKDYNDPVLVKMVTDYLNNVEIPNFKFRTVDIQILGRQ
ncbi:MAG: transcriptional repressor [Bacteroidales bacterium]|jgi:Fur family peroxide stress response transcriptional regulator|nr:transcriptional repressor [Bacteroidales bacterium]MBO7305165.1 transcriptional repressor [Bacteroidales bacterium]MBQ1218491.1 transcriptional repressor [Bacteroidales bacterium]MBQ1929837.1 transcriptional repressor [Bacteroidales bacterium]